MVFNKGIASLAPSRSIVFMEKAKQLQASDSSVISLAGGEPDFDTPKPIREELKRWLDQGYTHYTIGPGLPELRDKIAHKLKADNNCNYSPEGIIVCPGGKFAIYLAVRTLINAGDEVMYLEPGWVSYPSIIEASGGVSVPVRLTWDSGFAITLDALEERVTTKTRILIINYPNNPTGRVLTEQEAQVIKTFLERHPDILLLSDEIYERILFEGHRNISPASFPEIADRVITVNGFSKSVAMTGWRIGYLATTPAIKKIMYKLYQHTMSCVSGFIQKAAVVALDCDKEVEEMRRQYEHRRALFVGGLNQIPGVTCLYPEGAFYAWVKFDIPGMDSEQVCELILNEAKVVGVPGVAYGTDECCIRFSFAAAENDLLEAVDRIRKVVKGRV